MLLIQTLVAELKSLPSYLDCGNVHLLLGRAVKPLFLLRHTSSPLHCSMEMSGPPAVHFAHPEGCIPKGLLQPSPRQAV